MNSLKTKFTLLILIGGQSKRMGGGIKSFMLFNNKKIFDRILEKIEPQIDKIIVNFNEKEEILNRYKLPIIKDFKIGYLGPLAGIHAGLTWLKENDPNTEWMITVPGDTPFLPENLVSSFKKKISLNNKKIIMAKSNNKLHPVIGAWHTGLLNSLDDYLNKGLRKILTWAELHSIDFIEYNYKNYDPFFNINTKDDIKEASILEKKFLIKKE